MVGVAQGLIGSLTTAAVASDPLPAGTILIFDRPDGGTSIPSGWSQLTDVSGTPIAGYAIKGGFNQAIFTSAGTDGVFTKAHRGANSTTAGSHAVPAPFLNVTNVGRNTPTTSTTLGYFSSPAAPAGVSGHTHQVQNNYPSGPFTYAAADVTAEQGVTAPLITNSADENLIPPGAIIFSSSGSVFSGFSRKLWPALDGPQPVPSSTGLYTIASSGSANSVNKWPVNPNGLKSPNFPGGSTPMRYTFEAPSAISPVASRYWMQKNPADPVSPLVTTQESGGIHYHGPTTGAGPQPPSGTVRNWANFRGFGDGMMGHWHLAGGGSNYAPYFHWWKSFIHLLPCSAASAAAVQSGMIVMYSGSSAPTGWYVCDGNNGTPNLSDRFIGFNNAESGTNVIVGRSNMGTENTSVPGTPGWPTTAGPTYNAPTTSVNWYVDSGTDAWPHSHIGGSYRSSTFYTTGHPNAMPGTAHSHAFYTGGESPPAVPGTTTSVSTEYLPKHITVLFIQKA